MTKSKVDQTRARYLAYLDPAGATPEANAAKLDVLADMFIVLNAESVVSPLENSQLETAVVVSPSDKPADNGPWSLADTPTRWGKVFGFSPKTFVRRVADGKIRAKKLSDRSYQVHTGDLPSDQK